MHGHSPCSTNNHEQLNKKCAHECPNKAVLVKKHKVVFGGKYVWEHKCGELDSQTERASHPCVSIDA